MSRVVVAVAVGILAGELVDGFGAEAPGVVFREGTGGLEEVAEGVVVVGGGGRAGGGVDQGSEISVAVVGGEVGGAGGGIGEFEEPADASGPLKGLAGIEPPGVGLAGLFGVGVENSDLIPPVVNQKIVGGRILFSIDRDPGLAADATPGMVVSEGVAEVARDGPGR